MQGTNSARKTKTVLSIPKAEGSRVNCQLPNKPRVITVSADCSMPANALISRATNVAPLSQRLFGGSRAHRATGGRDSRQDAGATLASRQ